MINLTREQAIKVIVGMADRDDPHWENVVQDFYNEETDSLPSLEEVLAPLGITAKEIRKAEGLELGEKTGNSYIAEYEKSDSEWYDTFDGGKIGPVTHWMPLPPAPKEKDKVREYIFQEAKKLRFAKPTNWFMGVKYNGRITGEIIARPDGRHIAYLLDDKQEGEGHKGEFLNLESAKMNLIRWAIDRERNYLNKSTKDEKC